MPCLLAIKHMEELVNQDLQTPLGQYAKHIN